VWTVKPQWVECPNQVVSGPGAHALCLDQFLALDPSKLFVDSQYSNQTADWVRSRRDRERLTSSYAEPGVVEFKKNFPQVRSVGAAEDLKGQYPLPAETDRWVSRITAAGLVGTLT